MNQSYIMLYIRKAGTYKKYIYPTQVHEHKPEKYANRDNSLGHISVMKL